MLEKTTGKSFVKSDEFSKYDVAHSPSYMNKYLDVVKRERDSIPCKKIESIISNSAVSRLPFVRPQSVVERSRNQQSLSSIGYYNNERSNQKHSKRTPSINYKRPATAIGTVKAIEETIQANTPGTSYLILN